MNEIQQVVIDFTMKNSRLSLLSPFINTNWIVPVGKNNIEADVKKDTLVLLNFCTNDDSTTFEDVKSFALKVGFPVDDIVGARRSGPEIMPSNIKLTCIVKVKCTSSTAKSELIKAVNENQWDEVDCNSPKRARPDLTFAEREQGRRLHKELDDKYKS
uniref:Uncharacterized protein n=1 Tax=Romanomermis culicivorax TaxID=13658 RepID=A0A915IMH8_ROMCU